MSFAHWKGIFKIVEESGELLQVLGKMGPFPDGDHPDGAGDLKIRAEREVADLYAALDYFVQANGLSETFIDARRAEKLDKFNNWGLTGIPTEIQQ